MNDELQKDMNEVRRAMTEIKQMGYSITNEKNGDRASKKINIEWHIDDVLEIRPDLDDRKAMNVLFMVERKHDATVGVNWEVLDFWATELYPEGDAQ
jgi:hypothetical protein